MSRDRRVTRDELIGVAQVEAENHRQDCKRGGCTCGFCVWSVEHVLVMSMRYALDMADRESASAASAEVGRCGEDEPRAVHTHQAFCRLPHGHAGWHKSDDGCEWTVRQPEVDAEPGGAA